MFPKQLSPKTILLGILLLSALFRLNMINYPSGYVFDEVYHAFTAKEFLKGHKEAWEWWTTPPPGVAYEWTHPPVAKEVMAISMFIFQTEAGWAYRLPGALLGILSVYLIYLIAKKIFDNENIALTSAFIFSLDGLNFVQSRTGMNDVYFITFLLACLYFFLKDKFIISALFLGAAISSKWTGIYLLGLIMILLLFYKTNLGIKQKVKPAIFYTGIPLIMYLASYIPFFLQGHSLEIFKGLQQQMWWYHTNLRATHDYSSPWWSWPLNLYPVWYFVDYHKNGLVSNIFATGNPIMFWAGFISVFFTLYDFISTRSRKLLFLVLGYFIFILPWALSPRIMFLYHYSPSIPFLSIALGYQLFALPGNNAFKWRVLILALIILSFMAMYPFLVGIPLPRDIMLWFFKTNVTKNPFGG